MSKIEVNYAGEDDYECCKGQGAMVALDLATGKQLWVGRTMAEGFDEAGWRGWVTGIDPAAPVGRHQRQSA